MYRGFNKYLATLFYWFYLITNSKNKAEQKVVMLQRLGKIKEAKDLAKCLTIDSLKDLKDKSSLAKDVVKTGNDWANFIDKINKNWEDQSKKEQKINIKKLQDHLNAIDKFNASC